MVESNLYDESSDEELWLNVVNSLNCNNNSLSAVMNVNNCDGTFPVGQWRANQYHSEEKCS